MAYSVGSWQRFIRERLDRDYTSRRFIDALSKAQRNAPFAVDYQGKMGRRAPYSAREFDLRRLFSYEFGQQSPAIWLGGEHKATLPLAKLICQAFLCHWEMDMGSTNLHPWGVNKTPRKGRIVRPSRGRLYIGEWIAALDELPTAVAGHLKLNPGYLSQLVNNKKRNPSYWVLCEIADHLKIPVDYLRRPPPVVSGETISPEVLARILKPRH